jgi:hypothetical protein
MADTSGWITIKNMVKEILFETDRDDRYYKKYMHHVINGVRELNKFHYDNVKTTKVTCNSIGVIDMPSDFVKEVNLAYNYQGVMISLTRRDDMVRTTTTVDDVETLDLDAGEGVNLDTGENYSYATVGGKNDYYYTVDERNTRFIVRNSPTRTLFLQYISSGIDLTLGNSTLIPVRIKEALKFYVLYKDALVSDYGDKKSFLVFKNEYNEEVSKLKFLELPTMDELRDVLYETYAPVRR